MELQIKVFTEAQAEVVKSLLNDELFDGIISEDSPGSDGDDFTPSNYVWAIAPNNTNWDAFENELQELIPSFSFRREPTIITGVFFSAHPVWAEGRELTKEEFLSLFSSNQQE
jgi:hypothetical protein